MNTTIPMAKLPPTRKWPNASTTFPAAAAPVWPSIRMIRVDAMFSARRSNVVNSRMVGNAANSSVRWVNIATSSTIMESAMLKVNSKSRMKAGNGSTIIDRIIRMITGPASICHWVDFKLPGRRSIATRLAISVLLVQKIQRLRHRKVFRFLRNQTASQTPALELPYPCQHFRDGSVELPWDLLADFRVPV